jgi:hypothetical protein
MKTNFLEHIDSIRRIPTYLDWFWKGRRIQADFRRMKAEWIRIGGFKASPGQLLNFVSDYSLLCVEYATWTPTTIDDNIVKAVRYVITEHRDIVIGLIDWIRGGHEPNVEELKALAEMVSASPVDSEYSSPMMILYVISALYQILRFLKSLETTPTPPKPEVEPSPVRQPVLNLVRNFLRKRTAFFAGPFLAFIPTKCTP